MKSNQISVQNQRVQRITSSTVVVGIDIGKNKHAAQATNFRGIVLTKRAFAFSNSLSGFENLIRHIRKLQQDHGMNNIIVGMESTGHYFLNLADWLVKRDIEVVLVNPATTKRNKENRDNTPSKSDPKDALVIADAVSRGYYTTYQQQDEVFQRLRVLVRNRERWIVESGRVKNRITRWLDIRFPEYKSVFGDIFGPRSLATLRLFPSPFDLKNLTPEQVIESWAKYIRRAGGTRGMCKAVELLELARKSIGLVVGLEEDKWELQQLLGIYDRVQSAITEADQRIRELVSTISYAETLKSIGMPAPATAAILALAGDLRHYSHGNQLLRKAGLNLSEHSSGKYTGKVKLSKRGNALLRKHLFYSVIYLIGQNPVFKSLHEYNVRVKKIPKMKSVMKLIGKLARILVAMCRQNVMFIPAKIQLDAA